MRLLDSSALRYLNKVLGISGGSARAETYVDDDNVQLALNAAGIIRRGRTIGENGGIFTTAIDNTHSAGAASTASGSINPYLPGAAAAPYPNPFPAEELDVWVVGYQAVLSGGTAANLDGATFGINLPASKGFNVALPVTQSVATSAVVASTTALSFSIADFDSELALSTPQGSILHMTAGIPGRTLRLPFRVPRGSTLFWLSRTAGAGASVYRLSIMLGVFPAGLGQDAIGAG